MASDDQSGRVREAPLPKEVGDAEMDTQIEAMTSDQCKRGARPLGSPHSGTLPESHWASSWIPGPMHADSPRMMHFEV